MTTLLYSCDVEVALCATRSAVLCKGRAAQSISTPRDYHGTAASYTHCVYNATAVGCRSLSSRVFDLWRTLQPLSHVGHAERSCKSVETFAHGFRTKFQHRTLLPAIARHVGI
ncbi:unnamed protein product [Ectocarpus sp. 12 AP-2014]